MTLNIHTPPSSTTTSSLYTVTVNGSAARTYYTSLGSFVNFSTDTSTTIVVTFNTTVTTAVLSPQRKNIPLTISGNTVTFTLSNAADINGQYILRINDPHQTDDAQTPTWEPLFIFANPLEVSPPTGDTASIKYIGPGDWAITSSSTIVPWTGAETVSDNYYDIAQGKSVYIHGNAVVRGKFKFGSDSNVGTGITAGSLYGRGVIDASFTPAFGRIVRINHSSGVTVDGIVGIGQVQWGFAFRQSNNCSANNIKIINSRRWNGSAMSGTPDGIDVVASHDITVQNSFVRSYDDGCTVKSDQAGGGWAADTYNITYLNMLVWQAWGGNAMEIGYEVPNPVSNIVFKNFDVLKGSRDNSIDTRDAISMYLNDVGDVTNVSYENIYVEEILDASYSNYIGLYSNNTNAAISTVSYKNIVFGGQPTDHRIYFKGFSSGGNISGVTLQNIRFGGPGGKTIASMSQANLYPATSDSTNFRSFSLSSVIGSTIIPGAFNILHISVAENVGNVLRFRYTGSQSSVAPRFSVAPANGVFYQAGTAVFSGQEIVVTLSDVESASNLAYYRLELADQSNTLTTIALGYIKIVTSPISSYNLGNINGVTVDPTRGGVQYGTLTGNGQIQISTTSAVFGDKLILKLTQDGTGSRVPTWGSNVKNASSLVLSTGASKTDIISYLFDGTYWRESSRALGQS